MISKELQLAFNGLVRLIQTLVSEHKSNVATQPFMMLVKKSRVRKHTATDMGISVTEWETGVEQKQDLGRAAFGLLDSVAASSEFQRCNEIIRNEGIANVDEMLKSAVIKMLNMTFDGEALDSASLLDYFLKSIRHKPVPAWCDIETFGLFVRGSANLTMSLGSSRYTFRQLEIADFEQESQLLAMNEPGIESQRPNSMLRIELDTWRPHELDMEAQRALIILRLFNVCGVKFGRQTFATKSPFAMIFGAVLRNERSYFVGNQSILALENFDAFQKFSAALSSRFPSELLPSIEGGPRNITPITIAYERYCDSLSSLQSFERKIAFAVMGLEAIYLQELQELMYRLQLRVAKVMVNLGFEAEKIRPLISAGYLIRNKYVHGAHLDGKAIKKLEKDGHTLEGIALGILNCLRISILHLIVSGQSKDDFLALIDLSLIDRSKDDTLNAMLSAERAALNP